MSIRLLATILTNVLASVAISAQETPDENSYQDLIRQVQLQQNTQSAEKFLSIQDATKDITECPSDYLDNSNNGIHKRPQFGTYSQYIFNRTYSWAAVPTQGGFCIYEIVPLDRALSKFEAVDFYAATKTEFPPDKTEPTANSKKVDAGPRTQHDPMPAYSLPSATPVPQKKNDATNPAGGLVPDLDGADTRVPITNNVFPYNTLAYVTSSGTQGTAVQVSPYVYLTAAHIIVNAATGYDYTNIQAFPAYHLAPVATVFAAADLSYDSQWVSIPSPPDQNAHDIGFIRTAVAHPLPFYPARYTINSSADSPVYPNSPCPIGNYLTDAYLYLTRPADAKTWFSGLEFPSACASWLDTNPLGFIAAGYPEAVGGNSVDTIVPYADNSGFLQGNYVLNTSSQELVRPCSGCLAYIGMSAWVTFGDSGGPVFEIDENNNIILLGVMTNQVLNDSIIGGIGVGETDYNYVWVESNVGWTPAELVNITSPAAGGAYSPFSVPNLIGTAGQITSQLVWTSSINGNLGTGTNISVSGLLSPGTHTITAAIPGSTLATKSIQITVSPPSPPAVSATPSTVPVGLYAGSGPFTVSYSAPGYTSIDWYRSSNGGASTLVRTTSTSNGSFADTIAASTTYVYKLYPHGNSTSSIGSVTVHGIAATAPTFSVPVAFDVVAVNASTVNVLVTAYSNPQTAPFGFQWNAPGYTSLDLVGQINSGPLRPPGVIPPSGTNGDNMPINTTYVYRLYPHGDSVHVLTTFTVIGIAAPTPTFSASPPHVIVPAGGTSGTYHFIWSAKGYNTLDLSGRINGGAWGTSSPVPAVWDTSGPIPVGQTYEYRWFPHGDTVHLLGTATTVSSH